jgi:N-acetylhexosamine 1-kinase
MTSQEEENFRILSNFELDSKPISCVRFGNGHINKTFEVKTEKGGHYILQKVNDNVFKNVEMLMNNINYVSSYLIEKGFESLQLIKTKDGKLYDKENGQFFRVYLFSPNSIYFEKAEPNSPLIKETSEAYGDLHNNLSGIDASKLGEVIPDFHNTEKRFENFLKAVEVNYKNRKDLCQKEINEIIGYKKHYSVINDALAKKEINFTVTHNDPKINNVLFDKDTLKFRLVVDLDTVMPGTILYDFGDGLRSLFTGDNECSKDLSKIKVDFKIYEQYLLGYATKMKKTLTKKEIELLPFSIFLMAIELAIRFLDDFLRGDVYFGINNEDDNLTRARTQLTLSNDIYANLDLLNKKTKEIIDSIN